MIGFDLETTQLSPYHRGAKILTAAWSLDGRTAQGVVIDHPAARVLPKVRDIRLMQAQRFLRDSAKVIVGHNIAGFDVPWWEEVARMPVRAKLFDTRVAWSLIEEDGEKNGLGDLAERFGLGKKNEDGLDRRRLAEADPELVLKYNKQDAILSYRLGKLLEQRLAEEGLTELFDFLMSVARVLADIRATGTYVDLDWVREKSDEITAELAETERRLREMTGDEELNFNSPKQLAALLFDQYEMPVLEKTPTGTPKTSTDVLKLLRAKAPVKEVRTILDLLLTYRRLSKLVGTYLEPYANEHRAQDGRIHTVLHLGKGYGEHAGGTVTGRLSSSSPNLQNIPRDPRIKGAFAPTPGLKLFSADYSQVELRVAAWYAGEKSMLDAFRTGRDVHTATLAELEGRDYDEVNDMVRSGDRHWEEQRALIKRVNFGVLYGVGPYRLVKLMRDMGISITQRRATELIEWWFSAKPQMRDWIAAVHAEAVEKKQVKTPTGRIRHLPEAEFGTPWGERALRQSVNFLVQSFSADLMLAALVLLHTKFEREGGARLLLTVHDSVIGEYSPDEWRPNDLALQIERTMTTEAYDYLQTRFGVPPGLLLDVDIKPEQTRWTK